MSQHDRLWDLNAETEALQRVEDQVKRVADALEELVALAKEEDS